MARLMLVGLVALHLGLAHAADGDDFEHTRMITPDEEPFYRDSFWHIFANKAAVRYRFQQTTWGECSEAITGNFSGYKCSESRAISVILKTFIGKGIYTCINKGLAATGGGAVADLHIVHNGITGDANHSPRSLHAENRAIDIKSMQVQLHDGRVKNLVYQGTTNRAFYTAFRKCWGEIVHNKNGCPYVSQGVIYTGSIGWENANHQHHLHLSVPYCTGGRYSRAFYQR